MVGTARSDGLHDPVWSAADLPSARVIHPDDVHVRRLHVPATIRLPFRPVKVADSADQTISSGWRVRTCRSERLEGAQCGKRSQITVKIAAVGTESICEPKRIGDNDPSVPCGVRILRRVHARVKPRLHQSIVAATATSASE